MSCWKRGFLEIVAEILDSLASGPLRKTHITYKCNLDSRAVSKYLSIMIYSGLVKISQNDSNFFTVTEKGIQYRNQFNSFVSMVEKDLEHIPFQNIDAQKHLADLKIRSG